jgi:hypothetical protein
MAKDRTPPADNPDWMTVPETAELFGRSEATITRWIHAAVP